MGATTYRRHFLKEIARLIRHIDKISDGQVKLRNQDAITTSLHLEVAPNDGPYKGGRFDFAIKIPSKYPIVPPSILCLNHVYHPNIDEDGEICLSLIDDWDSGKDDIESCIVGILFLFHHPNLEDPLSPYFCPEDSADIDQYCKNVKKSLHGEVVEGFRFEKTAIDSVAA